MTYYVREHLPPGRPIFGNRRSTINEFFLSSYTLNVYTGCEYGCPYCDGWVYHPRPLNEIVHVPLDLPRRLAEALTTIDRRDLIGLTALSDPYQPIEQTYRITRQVLQVFADVGQPLLLLTRSENVLDDLPLLQRIHERSLAIVMMTILTLAPRAAQILEGKSPPPALRLETLKTLKQAGIPVGVAILPVVPYVNDTNYMLSNLLQGCFDAGVDFVIWDFLHIQNKSHYNRICELLPRLGSYPVSYYRDLYKGEGLPTESYRAEMNANILHRCDTLTLPVRVPHNIFAGKLSPANEAALLLKHTAFRDAVQGRTHMAAIHRDLAERIYQGETSPARIHESPLFSTLKEILSFTATADGEQAQPS